MNRRAGKRFFWPSLLCLWLLLIASVQAETLVLVQGYLGSGDAWRGNGITDELNQAGWADHGHLRLGSQGVLRSPRAHSPRRFYTLELPTEAPLLYQVQVLEKYLGAIRNWHNSESLFLVGHSAGGVLARLYLVRNSVPELAALVTIASPHLGTEAAELGTKAGATPLAWLAPLLGANTFNRAQGLFYDLRPERPSTLLFWLNRQEHPSASYVSLVRQTSGVLSSGDAIVPSWSQDMNNVHALRGRSVVIPTDGGHGLSARDGPVLVKVLHRLRSL